MENSAADVRSLLDEQKVLDVLEIFEQSGVPVIWTYVENKGNMCFMRWNTQTKKWGLMINRYTWDMLDPRAKYGLLLHELYHLHRLDPVMITLRNYDQELWNIASDVVINDMLQDNEWIQENGVTFGTLKALLQDENVPYVRDALPLYMYLRKAINDGLRESIRRQMDNSAGSDLDGNVPEEDKASAVWELLNIVRRGKRILENSDLLDDDVRKALEDMRNDTQDSAKSAGAGGSRELGILPPPQCPAWYKKWLQWYQRLSSSVLYSFKRKRSFRKEGIVDGLAGWGRKGKKKIAIFVDVSGSMDHFLREVLSHGKYLSRIADAKLYIFADECKLVPPSGVLPNAGGGTRWKPVKKVIDSLGPGYEITLVSDMCFFDEQPKIDPDWFVVVME